MKLPTELVLEILDYLPLDKYLGSICVPTCKGNPWTWAIKHHNLQLIKWLHRRDYGGCIKYTMNYAAQQGCLKIVEYLHHHRTEGCTTDAMDYAASNGHIHILEFLKDNRSEGCSYNAFLFAIQNNQMDSVKWLVEHKSSDCLIKAGVLRANHFGFPEIESFLQQSMAR